MTNPQSSQGMPGGMSPPPSYAKANIATGAVQRPVITDSHEVLKRPARMHPLIEASYDNSKCNPLCSLPDSVLIHIMRLLDPVTVACIRRCSRIFLRLFPLACRSTEDFSTSKVWGCPWPISEVKFQPEEKATFLSLMARDWYCYYCLGARLRPDCRRGSN